MMSQDVKLVELRNGSIDMKNSHSELILAQMSNEAPVGAVLNGHAKPDM